MEKNFSYPIDPQWTTDEINKVAQMLNLVADAYEVGVDRQDVLHAYDQFKSVVAAKSEEKSIGRDFKKASGYSLYLVVKTARQTNGGHFKMKEV